MKKLFTFFAFAFATMSMAQALPVEISTFTATKTKSGILIEFRTLSEVNASHFVIEKSFDGISFEDFSIIKTKGASNYKLIDTKIENAYYRLSQYDHDGKMEIFKVVSYQSQTEAGIKLIDHKLYSEAPLSIFDTQGRFLKKGNNPTLEDLMPGIYLAVSDRKILKFLVK